MTTTYFHSESLARCCIPESNLTNAFIVDKLTGGYSNLAEQLNDGKKISEVTCKDITGQNGFCSRIYKYRVQLTRGGEPDEQTPHVSVVLKLFSFDRITVSLKAFAGETTMSQNWRTGYVG